MPQFFGVSGQAQYGVDLVAEDLSGSTVYQCKNIETQPNAAYLREVLGKFEAEWLGKAALPKPRRFVLCCPHEFKNKEARDKWEQQCEEFPKRLGVKLGFWSRSYLDSRLSKSPDIVADLFSDRIAEAFCDDLDAWKPDLFWPVKESAPQPRRLKRYYERRKTSRLYLDPDHQKRFGEVLDRNRILLIRGLPGTGKTLMGVAFAEAFQDNRWRVYYLDVSESDATPDAIQRGIRRRLSRPSLFVLDDCHEAPNKVGSIVDRLQAEIGQGRLAFVCLARRVPSDEQDRGDDWDLADDLSQQGAVIDFETSPTRFRRVVETLKPAFAGLASERLARLEVLTGRDLLLLDDLLWDLASPEEIDRLDRDDLFRRVRRHYFGARALNLPTVYKLAALAQFDLAPPASRFDGQWLPEEREKASSLMVLAGTPARYRFLHSSLAELIFHALAPAKGRTNRVQISELLATEVADYLTTNATNTSEQLLRVLKARLGLLDDSEVSSFKVRLMEREDIQSLIRRMGQEQGIVQIASGVVFLLHRTGSSCFPSYVTLLKDALATYAAVPLAQSQADGLPAFGLALRTLQGVDEEAAKDIERYVTLDTLLGRLDQQATVFDLIKVLRYVSPRTAETLLHTLDEPTAQALVDKTIAAGRSIGTLSLTLRELRKNDPELATELERRLGAARLLRLVCANGTVLDLFKLIEHTSAATARAVVEALDEPTAQALVDKTIAAGRSIGTLHLTLFVLRKKAPELAAELERRIGPERLLRLVRANGTVFELFALIKNASAATARALVEALDEPTAQALVDKTIAAGQSIGTINLTLFELQKKAPDLAAELERRIGPEPLLRLVRANGTVFELFMLIKDASAATARALVEALDEPTAQALVDKTIAAGR